MNKKWIILVAVLGMFFATASAQTSLKMTFQSSDGSLSSIDAKSLSMSVIGDKLLASNGTESLEFDLQKLVKMYFTGEADGVEILPVDFNGGEVAVYTLDGKLEGRFSSPAVAMSSLNSGIYILHTTDNKTVKIAVQ